jgi:hypothetical protein
MSHNSENLTMTIVVDGQEQKIINGCTYIPFNTEYSIRLRNDNDVRIKFKICLDGDEQKDWFVVNAHSTITIERFMLGSLNNGPKFKFVKTDYSNNSDPGNPINGLVQLKILKEKVIDYSYIFPKTISIKQYRWDNMKYGVNRLKDYSIRWCGTTTTTACLNNVSLTSNQTLSDVNEKGITDYGSESNQKFVNVNDFSCENNEIILQIQLKPYNNSISSTKRINKPHNKKYYCDNLFCGYCGKEVTNLNFKFCPNCGNRIKH